jgi:plasmid maintenance system antidote protein VapI
MLVAVKTPRINVHLNGRGAQIVVRMLRKQFGDVKVSHEDEAVDITTTEWWKRMEATSHAGTVLWTYRDNAALTLAHLSKLSGIAKSHLSDMENGKRAIGPRTAKKLFAALGIDHRMFLQLGLDNRASLPTPRDRSSYARPIPQMPAV